MINIEIYKTTIINGFVARAILQNSRTLDSRDK